MLGLGKKDKDGKQVRIEHRGKHVRASRTGGVAVRGQGKLGPVNVTANSAKGIRASTRIANGTRAAFQNGRFQLIGRWRAGPLGFNLSKTSISASVKNEVGTFNFIKPRYSSFKVAGVQVRGKKAAQLHVIYMLIVGAGLVIAFAIRLVVFVVWVVVLQILFLWDIAVGFVKGVRGGDGQ